MRLLLIGRSVQSAHQALKPRPSRDYYPQCCPLIQSRSVVEWRKQSYGASIRPPNEARWSAARSGSRTAIAVPDWRPGAQALEPRLGVFAWFPSSLGAQGIIEVRA